ncbi:hypothetical protein ACFU5O_32000 [Streptomyces sp. NPDC057445]|uniref:hypothetical protein n=1 Tax=Streptomyces sp. NPDC057445 TaxID=3346136 RepID=UPI003674DE25
MSTQAERGQLAEILFREFDAYATALTQHGQDWTQAWPRHAEPWPTSTELARLHERFLLAQEAARAVGVDLTDQEITQQYRERLEYRRNFPNGMPSLTGP